MKKFRNAFSSRQLCLLLVCGLAAAGIMTASQILAESGGTSGGPLVGSLTVTVIEAGSDDGTGTPLPVPGAFVMVGLEAGSPFTGNYGVADANGEITFTDPALSGFQTVTAGANGYRYYSFVDVDASNVVIPLRLKNASVPTSNVTGSLSSFPGDDCDNWLQMAIVFPTLDLNDLVGFNVAGQLTDSVPITILGDTVYVPGNLVIPAQKEGGGILCTLFGATISKSTYQLYLPTDTTQDIFSFGVEMDVDALMGGDFDLTQIIPLEIGIARNVYISGNMTRNISMTSSLTQNLTLATNFTPAGSDVMLLSLGEINGDPGIAPGAGDLVLFDFLQTAGGDVTGGVLRTTPIASPFSDIRYVAMAIATFPEGSIQTGSTGVLDRSDYTPPDTRSLWTFFTPVQLDPVVGNLFSFSDAVKPGLSPQPDLNVSTLSLVTTVPDTSPGAEPGATVDEVEGLWTLASPGFTLAFYLPILPPEAPDALPFPEQTPDDDRLAWGQTVFALDLDLSFDFDQYDMDTFVETFTHFSANGIDFSVDADGDGVHLFDDNCPFVGNAGQDDLDGDGSGDACDPDVDGDGYQGAVDDCDDLDSAINPGVEENCSDLVDNDCDTLVDDDDPDCLSCTDNDGDDYFVEGGECGPVDCNDADPNINPGALEICDGADNNCNGSADEGLGTTPTACGVGECTSTGELACIGGAWADNCAPGDPAEEICDNLDNDCDGSTDEGLGITPTACGVGECASTGELGCIGGAWVDSCEPGDPAVEVCNDGMDNDCDTLVDIDDPDCLSCTDNDGDNFYAEGGDCGLVDCDDSNPNVYPGHPEVAGNGIDDDCDGLIDEGCFIATAAFGSLIEPRVVVLREFRDRHLMTSEAGRRFVEFYYTYSPPVAEYIAEKGWLKALVRNLLLPVIGIVSLIL